MPNGRHGDHPYTDIVCCGFKTFTPEIDDLVRELSQMPGFEERKNEVQELLWHHWPVWKDATPDYDLVLSKLLIIKHWLGNSGKE